MKLRDILKRLASILVLAALPGCGVAMNDRNATWHVADEELLEPAVAAAREWHERSDGEVNFTIKEGRCNAAEHCITFGRMTERDANGRCDIKASAIVILESDKYDLRGIILHELGHYLTGGDHSPNAEDAMFMSTSGNLTDADIERLDRTSREITESWD